MKDKMNDSNHGHGKLGIMWMDDMKKWLKTDAIEIFKRFPIYGVDQMIANILR